MSTASKIRIKMGEVEVEFEGSESFLREELKEILSGVVELHKKTEPFKKSAKGDAASSEKNSNSSGFTGTTNSVAAKLGVKTGPDLIIAALGRLTIVLGQDKCSRNDIIKEMQSANSYYKKTFLGNLTGYLKTLIKEDRIREVSTGNYSLSASELQSLKGKLVD